MGARRLTDDLQRRAKIALSQVSVRNRFGQTGFNFFLRDIFPSPSLISLFSFLRNFFPRYIRVPVARPCNSEIIIIIARFRLTNPLLRSISVAIMDGGV